MTRRRVFVFVHPTTGEFTLLKDPDGPPTARQLLKLNAMGALELVPAGKAVPILKAEAAAAIDDLHGDEAA
jgi:hypothetical protein